MKIPLIKTINESIAGSTVDTADLRQASFITNLVNELHDRRFPDSFKLTVKTSWGDELPLTFKLVDKSINDHPGWHQLKFVYELDSDSEKRKFALQRKAEQDESDPDGEKYDELLAELNFSQLDVHAELGKEIEKVYGHLS